MKNKALAFLLFALIVGMIILLFSGCAAIRRSNETFFYKFSEDIIANEYDNNKYIQEKCVLDFSKPKLIDVKQDALDLINPWQFPIRGIYYYDVGYIVYSSEFTEGLIHEYVHHFTRQSDLNCLRELAASMAMTIYELRDAKWRTEQKYFHAITRPIGQ